MPAFDHIPPDAPPVPVVVVANEENALNEVEKERRRTLATGYAAMGLLAAPVFGLFARLLFEWFEFGWEFFRLGS